MKLNMLAVLVVAGATGSLMGMKEDVKKQYFVIDCKRKVLPSKEKDIHEVLRLSQSDAQTFYMGVNDAENHGKGQVLYEKNNKQFLAKISLLRIARNDLDDQGCLVTIKPWNKVNVLVDNQ